MFALELQERLQARPAARRSPLGRHPGLARTKPEPRLRQWPPTVSKLTGLAYRLMGIPLPERGDWPALPQLHAATAAEAKARSNSAADQLGGMRAGRGLPWWPPKGPERQRPRRPVSGSQRSAHGLFVEQGR